MLVNVSLTFAAGCIGGLANSVMVWGLGKAGVSPAFGINVVPNWTPAWLYPRIVWGGIWGFLFLLQPLQNSIFLRGMLYSLGPTLCVLLIVFPLQAKKGLFGLQLGTLTPFFAFVVNAAWGITAAWWLVQLQH